MREVVGRMSPDQAPRSTPRFYFQPHHALCAVAGVWAVLALFTWPGTGCWVVAGAYAGGAWYTRARRTHWPADVEEYLIEQGWAPQRHVRLPVSPKPPVPFRPMTVAELFLGAFTIMLRNWPTMVGVPSIILTGIAVLLAAGMYLVVQMMGSPQIADLILGDDVLRFGAGPMMLVLALMLMFCAVVLPGDGLLISLGVHATDKALRGERIRFDEVVRRARRRKLAVCRLAGAYYLTGVVLLLIQLGAYLSGFLDALLPTMLLGGLVSLVMALLLSMSPVVLIVEDRGVVDSFRRSIQLCKPALGRIFVINVVMWVGCVGPVVLLSMVTWVVAVLACPVVFGLLRCLPMLIYADLRMREGDYGQQLQAEWARNRGCG